MRKEKDTNYLPFLPYFTENPRITKEHSHETSNLLGIIHSPHHLLKFHDIN